MGPMQAALCSKRWAPHYCGGHITHQMLATTFDPTNRLVAAELERRWNVALRVQTDLEEELDALRKSRPQCIKEEQRRALLALGADLRRLWEHPQSPPEHTKSILRTVLSEII